MLTEGAAPPDDLEIARSQSQRDGLQAAIDRNQAQMNDLEDQIRTSEAAARAGGAPNPDDAAVSRQADATAKAPAEPVPSDLQAQIADLEQQLGVKPAEPAAKDSAGSTPDDGPAPVADKPAAAPAAKPAAGEVSPQSTPELAPEHVAAMQQIDAASQKSAGFVGALKQAATCLLRGIA